MSPLFQYFLTFVPSLSANSLAALEPICSTHFIKKGQNLQAIGHTCRTIYFINEGLARIYYFKGDIDVTESFAFEHEIVVRAESLFTGRPSRKGIQMLEPSSVVAIDSSKLFQLFDTHHDLERLFRKIFEAAYVDTINRIESLQFHSAEERYRELLSGKPDLLKRVPLKYIASYLGITQVSLSRIRAQR